MGSIQKSQKISFLTQIEFKNKMHIMLLIHVQ
jgi:hypothetical protein